MTKKQFYLTLTLTVLAGFVGGLLSGLLLNAGVVSAQFEDLIPEVIRAQRFVIHNSKGQPVAFLSPHELRLQSQNGTLISLSVSDQGSHLTFLDANLKPTVHLTDLMNSRLVLSWKRGMSNIGVDYLGFPYLNLVNGEVDVRVNLSVTENSAGLKVKDKDDEIKAFVADYKGKEEIVP